MRLAIRNQKKGLMLSKSRDKIFIFIVAIFIIVFLFARSATAASKAEIKRVNRYVKNTPMKGTGKIIVNQAEKYDINPSFVVGVAAKESSLGEASCSGNPKNVWGLGACGRAWNAPYFQTWVEAVNYFIRFVVRQWPRADNPFQFSGYCNGCEVEWGNAVSTHMRRISGTTEVRR